MCTFIVQFDKMIFSMHQFVSFQQALFLCDKYQNHKNFYSIYRIRHNLFYFINISSIFGFHMTWNNLCNINH